MNRILENTIKKLLINFLKDVSDIPIKKTFSRRETVCLTSSALSTPSISLRYLPPQKNKIEEMNCPLFHRQYFSLQFPGYKYKMLYVCPIFN